MKKTQRWHAVYLAVILLLVIGNGYALFQNIQLQKQLTQSKGNISLQQNPNESSELSFSEMNNKVKNFGSISGAKTVNTDKWVNHSDVVKKITQVKFDYQYPDNLYMVPSVRGFKNTLNFFENKAAYQKYVKCIADGKTSQVDWEGACDLNGDLLFVITVSPAQEDIFLSHKPSDLVEYIGVTDDFGWKLPKDELSIYGGYQEQTSFYAEGKTKNDDIILVDLNYPDKASAVEKIKNLTHMDLYPLFIHILSTFTLSD